MEVATPTPRKQTPCDWGGFSMPKFRVFSGETFEVIASNAAEAEKKYLSYLFGNQCVCDQELCKCVKYLEVETEVTELNADI